MLDYASLTLRALVIFFLSLSSSVKAVAAHDQAALHDTPPAAAAPPPPPASAHSKNHETHYYSKGDPMPVTCLNRTLDTGEHITDAHGNLQYIPFPTCAETNAPLSFAFGTPQTQTCTIPELPDELYHLLEFFVHSDVPLTCRVPTYPLLSPSSSSIGGGEDSTGGDTAWTPLTIALHGTLQFSHLHMHTNINVLFHTTTTSSSADDEVDNNDETDSNKSKSKNKNKKNKNKPSTAPPPLPPRLLASTAYSLPNTSRSAPREGAKVMRTEPLTLTFNVGWIDGASVPSSSSSSSSFSAPLGVVEHTVGFSLLSFFACAASAGVGAMGMLVYERRRHNKRSGMYSNGILGGNVSMGMGIGGRVAGLFYNNTNNNSSSNSPSSSNASGGGFAAARSSGYGGYGGYSSSSNLSSSGGGKRD